MSIISKHNQRREHKYLMTRIKTKYEIIITFIKTKYKHL